MFDTGGKGRKAPVGTMRHWQQGDVIKAHENSKFQSGWMAVPKNNHLLHLGRRLDSLANQIIAIKEPIDGIKYLDHELNNYKKEEGSDGPYHANDFKQYYGHSGSARYSFSNEFMRRWMSPGIELRDRINEALIEANYEKKVNEGKLAYDGVVLTGSEIERVKREVKSNYQYEGKVFDPSDAEELSSILHKVHNHLLKGFDLTGEEKRVYDESRGTVEMFTQKYQRIEKIRQLKKEAIEAINTTFEDNWGVRDTFKDYVESQYSKYVEKYRDQILEDSGKDQEEFFGTKIDAPFGEFYDAVFEKLQKDPDAPFRELMYLRFKTVYDKELKGEWKPELLPGLEKFEELILNLPEGHLANNPNIRRLVNADYMGGDHTSYAWFSPSDNAIFLSEKAADYASIAGRITDPYEFNWTLIHEIGHGVSQNLGRQDSLLYRKFLASAGWSMEQTDIKTHSTGGNRKIRREGSRAGIPLITDYAQQSPEEAFAEYYSLYSQYKDQVDKFLDTGETKQLRVKERVVIPHKESPHPVSIGGAKVYQTVDQSKFDTDLRRQGLDPQAHLKLDLSNPFRVKVSKGEQNNYNPSSIRYNKSQSLSTMPPVMAIEDHGGSRTIIDGVNRTWIGKLKKRGVPTFSISREAFNHLRNKGYSVDDIKNYAYTSFKLGQKIPYQNAQSRKVMGIPYRNNVIDMDTLKRNRQPLQAMRKIWHSDDLAKALAELFEK